MSLVRFVQNVKSDLRSVLTIISHILKNDHQKFGFNLAVASSNGLIQHRSTGWSLKEIFDGFLWHAPRGRRGVERRLRRRFGYANKYEPTTKLIKKKRNLVICDECGTWHELENLCQTCYEQVKKETKLIQERIMKKLGLAPVEKEVAISYENERTIDGDRYFVEIPKERPAWFSANLTSNSVSHKIEKSSVAEHRDLEAKIDK